MDALCEKCAVQGHCCLQFPLLHSLCTQAVQHVAKPSRYLSRSKLDPDCHPRFNPLALIPHNVHACLANGLAATSAMLLGQGDRRAQTATATKESLPCKKVASSKSVATFSKISSCPPWFMQNLHASIDHLVIEHAYKGQTRSAVVHGANMPQLHTAVPLLCAAPLAVKWLVTACTPDMLCIPL